MVNQCSSCGGFCKKSGCERENVKPITQHTWLGLTEQDMPSGEDSMFDHEYFIAGMVYADKVLKDKNNA